MLEPLSRLPCQLRQPIIFVGGKGGVGKTTTAAALASHFASQNQKTLIVSTDPAHSLGDVLNVTLDNSATTVAPNLDAIELNPDIIVDQHFAQVERTIKAYANPEMLPKIHEHLKLSKSAPGATEAAMLEAMCQHLIEADAQNYDRIIFDTAPTGHTLRLLVLPEMMGAWTDGLLAQQRRQAKLKQAAQNLSTDKKKDIANPFSKTAPDRWSQAVSVLEARKALFRQAGALLHDPDKSAIVLVMTADVLPLAETRRAASQLKDAKLNLAAIVVNQLIHHKQSDAFWQKRTERQNKLLDEIEVSFAREPIFALYLQQTDIRGHQALAGLFNDNAF